jgi:glycine dehydrogenase subunit 1
MLKTIGASSIDELFVDVPKAARLSGPVDLPAAVGEMEVEQQLQRLAERNISAGSVPFFVGAGAYRHHVPATVDHIIQRGEFMTSYTPYQPEIAQGTLQYLFEFQTQVAQLMGLGVANASLYDGSTACGEAILMARRITRRKKAILSGNLHPHYRAVSETLTRFTDDELVNLAGAPEDPAAAIERMIEEIDDQTSCVVVQNPDVFGHVIDLKPLADAAHRGGALLVVVVTEAVSLGALVSPGEMGADIAVGEGQSIGIGLNFGGPYLGLFAAREKFVRQMPGRLCGETVDAEGNRGYVLTLSTREQHIRREKATSNICTNSGLCSLAFSVHMSLLGEAGLRRLALINHKKALDLRSRLIKVGVDVLNKSFFNEITVRLNRPAAEVVAGLAEEGILAGVPADRLFGDGEFRDLLLLAVTETTSEVDIERLTNALRELGV